MERTMNLAINESISDKELIQRITSRDVSEVDLMSEFHISDSALRKYKRNTSVVKLRQSEHRMKLIVLDYTLDFLAKRGMHNPFNFLKGIFIKGTPLLKFINEYAKDVLVIIVIEEVLKSKVKQAIGTKPLDRYREKYEYLNNETLSVASDDDPELLKELIEDKELRPSTRGDILEALAVGAKREYFEYIKSKINETAPHVREAAFLGLYEYFDNSSDYAFLKNIFREKLEKEQAEGVQKTISDLLEEMQAAWNENSREKD